MILGLAYQWHFEVVARYFPSLLRGVVGTVEVSALSMGAALVLGLVLALVRLSKVRFLSGAAYVYIEFFRNTPFLVQIIWVFNALPIVTGLALTAFVSGIVALTLNLTAFLAEIYRAGITSIGPGQREAGLALGMNRAQLYRRIVLPQAITRIIPPLGSIWVSLFKDTSLLSVIGVAELMQAGRVAAVESFRPLEIFSVVALLYYLLAYPQSAFVNHLYHKFRVRE